MYKVLLVEDEPLVRLSIKSLVDWEENGFNLDFEATNGRKALSILQENKDIDIILTDINMPIMNGIEFIKEVRTMGLQCEIIVLSAYDDYKLVRDAFKFGITDYILKNEMQPSKILELFISIVKNRTKLNDNVVEIRNEKKDFLKRFMNGYAGEESKEIIAKYGFKISSRNLSVCYLLIDNFKDVEEKYKNDSLKTFVNSITNVIEQVFFKFNIGEVVCIYPEEYVLILSVEDNSMMKVMNIISDVIESIRCSLLNYMNIKITVGLSEILSGYENIPTLFKNAEKNARLRYIIGKGKNISSNERKLLLKIKDMDRGIASSKFHGIYKIKTYRNTLIDEVLNRDEERYLKEIKTILELIGSFQAEKIEDIYIYYAELYFLILDVISESNTEGVLKCNKDIDVFQTILSYETKEEIENCIFNTAKILFSNISEINMENKIKIIKKADKYIYENCDKKIRLEDVSKYVGLSEGYFCRLFIQNTGENFIAYLNKIRIEKAKKLLKDSNLKIYEISELVGYINVEHFSRTFKKITSMSPKEFQKK